MNDKSMLAAIKSEMAVFDSVCVYSIARVLLFAVNPPPPTFVEAEGAFFR